MDSPQTGNWVVHTHIRSRVCACAIKSTWDTHHFSWRKLSQMVPNPRNSRKFSPSKVYCYTVLVSVIGVLSMVERELPQTFKKCVLRKKIFYSTAPFNNFSLDCIPGDIKFNYLLGKDGPTLFGANVPHSFPPPTKVLYTCCTCRTLVMTAKVCTIVGSIATFIPCLPV